MEFIKKSQPFWKARTTVGRKKLFKTPANLWAACMEYFDWVENNPLEEAKLVSYQGESTLEAVPKMRAMTISGLCIFLNITPKTLINYKNREPFLPVINQIHEVIRAQKFEGASAGLLNANIIARDLGLKDHTVQEHQGDIKVDFDPEKIMKERGIPVPQIDIDDIKSE